jgi:Uma2 family endonuclease
MAQPVHRLLTLEEFSALPEDDSARYELQEGVLVMSPRPRREHQKAVTALLVRLDPVLPAGWLVLADSELVVRRTEPAIVRAPDIMVLRDGDPKDAQYAPGDVALAIEIISPGSRNLDRVLKAYEYAQAGIPQYWVVDLEEPSIAVFTLGPEGYAAQDPVSDELRVTVDLDGPVELVVDVAALGGDNSG